MQHRRAAVPGGGLFFTMVTTERFWFSVMTAIYPPNLGCETMEFDDVRRE